MLPCLYQRLSLSLLFVLILGGPIATAQTPATAPAKAALGERTIEPYRLGSGDKVRVTTFGEESLTGQFDVSGSGFLALPLIGEVRAQGLTTTELQSAIEAALRDGYLKDPKVSVAVLEYLAAGRPVVSTRLPALADQGDLALFAEDAESFAMAVDRALAGEGPSLGRRLAAAREHTYAIRTERMLELIDAIRRPPPPLADRQ